MLSSNLLLPTLICLPLLFGILCRFISKRIMIKFVIMLAGIIITAALSGLAIYFVFIYDSLFCVGDWFFLDSLSAFNLIVLTAVFLLTSLYAVSYFRHEIRENKLNLKQAGRFTSLWLFSLAAMNGVLISNNIAIIWVGIEATTLLTAFLISIHEKPFSIEAMWKYIIICSVGVAFAFIGTIFLVAGAKGLSISTDKLLFWTILNENAAGLNQIFVKAGFIFLLIGYGTKAGLSPMHTWLPDAHSQSPSPVSALFSGFMLSEALYCITRFIPIVERATSFSGWALALLNGFGLLSLFIAAIFILFQKDIKRLLAYSSVEHMGIVTFGLGLGGFGVFAALFHTLNHSLCKILAFFSAGKTGQIYGTHDMQKITNITSIYPVWGIGLLASLFVLIGVAPFAIFMSELMIIKAAIDSNSWISLILFLFATTIVFIAVVKKIIDMAGGEKKKTAKPKEAVRFAYIMVFILLGSLFFLGLYIPSPLYTFIEKAARIVSGGR